MRRRSNLPPREFILAKAGELFHLRGYGSVTIEEVITSTGLSRAAFHQHFSSKSKLGAAWLERLAKRMSIMQQGFLDKPGDRDRRLRCGDDMPRIGLPASCLPIG